MVAWRLDTKHYVLSMLLVFVLAANFLVYRFPVSQPVPREAQLLVMASIVDLAIVSPIFILAIVGAFSVKRLLLMMVGGLLLVRWVIPQEYLASVFNMTQIDMALGVLVFVLEIGLLIALIRYVPSIVRGVKQSKETFLFSFPVAMEQNVRDHSVIRIFVSEILMFYYAFFSWKKSADETNFTLHKKSSLIMIHIMTIHAIAIETIGLHWWLHEQSASISLVLLILNVYSIAFLVGEIQAIRLNPARIESERLYLSLGLTKRMIVSLDEIESITVDRASLDSAIDKKTTIAFIAKDFEEVKPELILELKNPCKATHLFGIQKSYTRVALRIDEHHEFLNRLVDQLEGQA
ncbi:beta-carotene 15,15'-monooxygenase [Alkalihalobacillus sp. CinArs1]|uniref:beta-carotene 15,15'-monooxygenase n=1 Tax=Alkalihalobacillus sp. CinArs1 TaxID=2995314 RepID=UPI0022DDD26A|nr:beta-carotene 15,15'-monooxygenase [Alkalihalobacillus sp. CinArs1]